MYSIYIHIVPNGKVYIGCTSQEPKKRWNNGNHYKENFCFNSDIKKYGWGNIEHKILYKTESKTEAENIEKELILKYKSNNSNYGYNIQSGGYSGFTYNSNTKENRSLSHKNQIPVNKIKVKQYTKDNVFIKEYESFTEASKYTNIECSNISRVVNGKRETAGGFIWK